MSNPPTTIGTGSGSEAGSDPTGWTRHGPRLWRSNDRRFAVVATALPDDRARHQMTYTLRCVDPDMDRAYPGGCGYFLEERYNLEEAQGAAERYRYAQDHASDRSVPADYEARALERFYWPIADGTTRGALVITQDDDGFDWAQIVGMARGEADADGESRFAPVVHARVRLP